MALSYAFMPETRSVVSVIDGVVSVLPERTARSLRDGLRRDARRLPWGDAYFTERADEIDAALARITPELETV